jgi:Domain of unknown function (DUF3943)
VAHLAAATALVLAPELMLAQARSSDWASLSFQLDSAVPTLPDTAVRLGSLPCPDCNPPKRFWAAAGEWMAVQVVPWAFTRFIRNGEWSRLSIDSWLTNLKFSWQWDNNDFSNNQFSHPYHGAMYFNAARANGYNFWESAPWAFGGSLFWELFGEVWAPAPNDLANTTLGGISLGEMLFRFSSLVLDNRATGSNRVVREVAGTLINPVRGFNRLVRGEMSQVSETPPDWRPTFIQGSMDVGYRRLSSSPSLGGPTASDQAFVQFSVLYGDPFTDLRKAPFSTFQAWGTLASKSEKSRALQDLRVRGSLAAKPVGSDSSNTLLALLMTYEYISNPVIDFGAQGFQGGIVTRTNPQKPLHAYGEAMVRANPIAAIRSDYFVTAEGRDYDYGVGLGGRVEGRAVWAQKGTLRVNGGYIWLPVVSGFSGNHHVFTFGADLRGYINQKLGVGVTYARLWRRSRYTFKPDVDEDLSEFRVFGTINIPRWQ